MACYPDGTKPFLGNLGWLVVSETHLKAMSHQVDITWDTTVIYENTLETTYLKIHCKVIWANECNFFLQDMDGKVWDKINSNYWKIQGWWWWWWWWWWMTMMIIDDDDDDNDDNNDKINNNKNLYTKIEFFHCQGQPPKKPYVGPGPWWTGPNCPCFLGWQPPAVSTRYNLWTFPCKNRE